MRRCRLPAPFVPQAACLRSTAAGDNDACAFPSSFHSRIRRSRPLQATRPALRPEGSHLSQVAGPPSLFFSAGPVQRTILAEGAARLMLGGRGSDELALSSEVEILLICIHPMPAKVSTVSCTRLM